MTGSKFTSVGCQPKYPCTQPQKNEAATTSVTSPSFHQKRGADGVICDQAKATKIIANTRGAQAPCANTAQAFFQLIPNRHHASQKINSDHPNASWTSFSAILLKTIANC